MPDTSDPSRAGLPPFAGTERTTAPGPDEYPFRMQPEVQWCLVEILSSARGQAERLDSYEAKQGELRHFGGVLAAFRYLEAITDEEQQDWFRRMLVALGYESPPPATPGFSRAVYVGDPAKRPSVPEPRRLHRLCAPTLAPTRTSSFTVGDSGLYPSRSTTQRSCSRWRASPEPDVASVFPDEVAALEQDLVGLEDWAAKDLRWKGHAKLRMTRLYRFGLTDDLGTPYTQIGMRHGSGDYGTTGEVEFTAPPPEASLLTLSWLDLEVPVPIT